MAGVSILGEIPRGLLGFENPLSGLDSGTQLTLFASAITLALVGYMEVRSAVVQWWGQGHRGSRRLEEACGPGWLGDGWSPRAISGVSCMLSAWVGRQPALEMGRCTHCASRNR